MRRFGVLALGLADVTAAEVRQGMTDRSYDRWINGVPLPAPPAVRARFWGAQ